MAAEFDTSQLVVALGARGEAQRALEAAEATVRSAVETLNAQGMTQKAIAEFMGVSKQAVCQMLSRVSKRAEREWEESQEGEKWDRYADRKHAESERGLVRGSFPCEHCGRFKARPADECGYCGSTLLTHNGNAAELNRSYGYAA